MSHSTPPAALHPRLSAGADILALALVGVLAELLFSGLSDGMVLGRYTQKILTPAQTLVLIGAASVLLRRQNETWRTLAFRAPISVWRAVGLAIAGYFGVICVNAVLVFVVFPRLGGASPNLKAFASVKANLPTFIFWLAIAWSTAAIGEELLFRGFLQSRLERLASGPFAAPIALVLQAAVFGLAHSYQGAAGVLTTASLGLVLGVVRLVARRNLAPGMLLHALIDTVSLTVVFIGVLPKSMGA